MSLAKDQERKDKMLKHRNPLWLPMSSSSWGIRPGTCWRQAVEKSVSHHITECPCVKSRSRDSFHIQSQEKLCLPEGTNSCSPRRHHESHNRAHFPQNKPVHMKRSVSHSCAKEGLATSQPPPLQGSRVGHTQPGLCWKRGSPTHRARVKFRRPRSTGSIRKESLFPISNIGRFWNLSAPKLLEELQA